MFHTLTFYHIHQGSNVLHYSALMEYFLSLAAPTLFNINQTLPKQFTSSRCSNQYIHSFKNNPQLFLLTLPIRNHNNSKSHLFLQIFRKLHKMFLCLLRKFLCRHQNEHQRIIPNYFLFLFFLQLFIIELQYWKTISCCFSRSSLCTCNYLKKC